MFNRLLMPTFVALATTAPAVCGSLTFTPTASAGEGLHCRGEMSDTLAPGVALEPGPSDIHTAAPGVLTCRGSWKGTPVTGHGSYTMAARFDDDSSCAGGSARGIFRFVVETISGAQTIKAPFTFTFFELPRRGGLLGGSFHSETFTGGFDVTPTAGNCVTEPVTADHAICDFDFGSPAVATPRKGADLR